MHRLSITAAGLGACLLIAAPSGAQAPESANVDIADCLELESRERQLECVEERFEEALETREAAAEAAREAEAAAAAAASEASRQAAAGLPGGGSDEPDEIVATITSFREVEPNEFLISLDNGQVWRQNRPRRYLLRVGAEVRLRSTHFGPSYRLTDPEVGSFIQVERVR